MGGPTDEEVRRVSDAMFLADEAAGPFGAGYKKKAEAAISEMRAMDREKLKLSEAALHRLTRQSWDNDSPSGT